jgi:hypothetical protein
MRREHIPSMQTEQGCETRNMRQVRHVIQRGEDAVFCKLKSRIALAMLLLGSAAIAHADDGLSGTWIYRSFVNDTEAVGSDKDRALKLIFGEGDLVIERASVGQFQATLSFGSEYRMQLAGTLEDEGHVRRLTAVGTGVRGTKADGWVYQYLGFVVPQWTNAVNQKQTIVGTVLRTVQHGTSPAGVTASFVIIKKDDAKTP